MERMKGDTFIGILTLLTLILIVTFFTWVGLWMVRTLSTERFCLKNGYAELSVDFTLNAYCIQRDYRGVMKSIPIEKIK